MSDAKDLFDANNVKFFDGAPQREALEPGELGVNIDLFRQIRDHYHKAKENIACRVLADICQDIKDNGYIGRADDCVERLSTAPSTVQRWRHRFVENGFLIRHNLNGRFSVDPKVAMRIDKDGKVIKPTSESKANFRF